MNPALARFAQMALPGRPPPTMMPAMPPSMSMPPQAPPLGMMPPGGPPNGPPGGPPGMPPASMPGPAAPPPMPAAPRPQIDPSRVIRPVDGIGAAAARAGRGGDSIMAHMTPGEIAVPPEVQTPEVLATLNRAFAQMRANPTSFQAGHPDQKINPETGMPEFGFFDTLLPIGLGIAGSALLGPEILLAMPELAAMLGAAAPAVAGGVGSAVGTTAGNLLTGKPAGESFARGAISGAGSAAGGYIGSQFGSAAPAAGAFSDATTVTDPTEIAKAMTETKAALQPNFFKDALAKMTSGQGIGAGVGGLAGGMLADSLYPPAAAPGPDLGPHMGPPGPLSQYIGGGSSALSGNGISAGAARFPSREELLRYGQRPGFNFFPT